MEQVPKYVLKLLERRRDLSRQLMEVCNKVDDYCEKIGVDFNDPNACLLTDVRIYCEFDGAYKSTLRAIKKTLGVEDGERRNDASI